MRNAFNSILRYMNKKWLTNTIFKRLWTCCWFLLRSLCSREMRFETAWKLRNACDWFCSRFIAWVCTLKMRSHGAQLAEHRSWLIMASCSWFRSVKIYFPMFYGTKFPECAISADQSQEPSRRSLIRSTGSVCHWLILRICKFRSMGHRKLNSCRLEITHTREDSVLFSFFVSILIFIYIRTFLYTIF